MHRRDISQKHRSARITILVVANTKEIRPMMIVQRRNSGGMISESLRRYEVAIGRPLKAERVRGSGSRSIEAMDDNAWSMTPCDEADDSSDEKSADSDSQGQREEVSSSKNEDTSMMRRRAALAQVEGAMM